MKVLIRKSKYAYTPEAYAYESFLKSKKIEVVLSEKYEDINVFDVCIDFMGFIPFWKADIRDSRIAYIHEYHSLSTPPYPKFKDIVKRYLSKKPAGRIFLNEVVKENLHFGNNVPFIFRDMGIDKGLFNVGNKNADFDIIYCGSIDGRNGLVEEIVRLANLGLMVLVVGKLSDESYKKLQHNYITLIGAVSRHDLPAYYAKARFGLNFTPDVYPYNIQTSTKVLEYCAAGLGVISNKYAWVSKFAEERKANFLYSHMLLSKSDVFSFDFVTPNVFDLEWHNLLERVDFHGFLQQVKNRVA
ncbi:MAG: glycosyl transferase [Agitococcus sp.]|nr:glycosyl transferase [Agitococcus sp.]